MARSPLCAAHVGKLVAEQINKNAVDKTIEPYGKTIDEVFVLASRAKRLFGASGKEIPLGAIGVYSYYQRLSQGLRQLMCGSRKFALEYLTRNDIVTLTRDAAEVTGIRYIMDADSEEVEQILTGKKKTTKAKAVVKATPKPKPKPKLKPKITPKPKARAKGKAKK